MKVLKFGGSSVGSSASILNVKKIVESTSRPVVVIVSALGGVTDQLIDISAKAAEGNESYKEAVNLLAERHFKMIDEVIAADKKEKLCSDINILLEDLRSILQGVFLIQDLTRKTADAIVAYGERLSSLICAALIDNACNYDSRTFIKTTLENG